MTGRLGRLLTLLQQERRRPPAERTTGVGDAALDAATASVAGAVDRLASGDRRGAGEALDGLARQVGDTWSHDSAVAVEVLVCAQALRVRDSVQVTGRAGLVVWFRGERHEVHSEMLAPPMSIVLFTRSGGLRDADDPVALQGFVRGWLQDRGFTVEVA